VELVESEEALSQGGSPSGLPKSIQPPGWPTLVGGWAARNTSQTKTLHMKDIWQTILAHYKHSAAPEASQWKERPQRGRGQDSPS
jgi:hypothetical protein